MKYWIVAGLTGLLTLSACKDDTGEFVSGQKWDVDAAAATPVPDNPMLAALHATYVDHARYELEQPDWVSVADYVVRIRQVSEGSLPAMRDPATLDVDEFVRSDLDGARGEILALQASPGARLRAGAELGEGQGNFDCWAEQADEGHQGGDIDRCRTATLDAIARIKKVAELPRSWVVVLPEEGEIGGISLSDGTNEVLLDSENAAASADGGVGLLPVDQSEIATAFADAQAATPLPARTFVLTFETGRSEISSDAFEEILAAADDVRRRNTAGSAAEILITGHADAVGEGRVNLLLSQARARRVSKAVFDELRPTEGGVFSVRAKGEQDLAIPTPLSEEKNRRVTILVR